MNRLTVCSLLSLMVVTACGESPPPAAPVKLPTSEAKVPHEVDLSPVPEPGNLIVIGRVQKPEAAMKTVAGWADLPLPGAAELVRSVTDEAVASAVDLSKPVDAAVVLGGSVHSPKLVFAFAVAVTSLDDAKTKLAAKHPITPGPNGSFFVAGIGKPAGAPPTSGRKSDDDDDEGIDCTLAPATTGARLVCGAKAARETLVPYLTRTMPRLQFTSDLHIEVRFAPLRKQPVQSLKTLLPMLVGRMRGGPNSVKQLADASKTELAELVNDVNTMSLDMQFAEAGAIATVRFEFQSTNSGGAKLATSHPERADVPPPAFFHLPAETDTAVYTSAQDSKLFDKPRELLGNVLVDVAESQHLPEAERKALRDLAIDRTAMLLTGARVYARGFDQEAVEKALEKYVAKLGAVKVGDRVAQDIAETELSAQVTGWNLVQVGEPITKIGPLFKDWSTFFARPGFKNWVKDNASAKMEAKLAIAAAPAGLPKDTVHLEISIPQADLEADTTPSATPKGTDPSSAAKPKRVPRKPFVIHVIAVPDAGATWIAFGLDPKLLASRAAIALSSASDWGSLAKTAAGDVLRTTTSTTGSFFSLRGLAVFTAMDAHNRRPPAFSSVNGLPNKGRTPITFTVAAEPASANAPGGTSVSIFTMPRGAIQDIVKLALVSP